MNKRMLLLSLILLLLINLLTGCLNQNKSDELKVEKYVLQDTELEAMSWILLEEDNKFQFNRHIALSYLPTGTYSVDGNRLTLHVDENESYVFIIEKDKLIFESTNVANSLIKEGAVFKLSDSHNEEIPEDQSSTTEDNVVKELILEYLLGERSDYNERVYFSEDEPNTPQEGDYRIDNIRYAGEVPVYESIGVAYEINYSRYYFTRDEKLEKIYGWHKYEPYYIVLRHSGYDDTWDGVFGQTNIIDSSKSIGDIILEVVYNLQDIEASLMIDGYPQRVGPFSAPNFFNEEPDLKILEEWEPIYGDGDYWIQYYYNNLTATCYYNSEEKRTSINRIETTRADVATHGGIRVGATRDEVLEAYPSIYNTPYWGYQGDYLWYCDNNGGYGAALLFWFENNTVVKTEINSMLD